MSFLDSGAYSTSAGGAGKWQLSYGGKTLTLFGSGGSSKTLTISSLTGSTLRFFEMLDSKSTYTVEGSGPNPTYTYYDAERTTLTH